MSKKFNFLGLNVTLGEPEVTNVVKGRRRASVGSKHQLEQQYRTREDMSTHRLAIDQANNIDNYNRYDLHKIYKRNLEDPVVSAQWNTRVLKTIGKEFNVTGIESKEPDKAAMTVFQAPWFHEWIHLTLEKCLWGFSLIEFGPWDANDNAFKPYMDTTGRYHTAVEAVDRDYVKPEFGVIVSNYGDPPGNGYNYLSTRASERLMFVGGPRKEESILYKISGYQLMKNNAHANWSEWAEVFATDFRIGKTTATGADRDKFIDMMRDLGNNSYAVVDEEDIIEYLGVNRQDAYQVYLAFLSYCDEKISELIFGQSVVSNNTGRVVGKVGEGVSNLYGDADAKFIEWMINTELIPFMNASGADLDGMRFKYDTTEKVTLVDRAKIDAMIIKSGWKISQEYLQRTYGIQLEEYLGIPFSGREEGSESTSND